MSTTNKQATHSSISNFTSILDAAAKEYRKLTKKDLHTHPSAAQFHKCDSPHAVLDVFRKQAQAFEEFRKGDDRLMTSLDPTINILLTCSATIGEALSLVPFSPAKLIFTGIGFLLTAAKDVVTSHNTLVNLFERVQFFLQRLNIYNGIPLTTEMTELFGKIMAQILLILALSTKEMSQRRIKKYVKSLLGLKRTEGQDALERLDVLTREESGMAVARNLEVAHDVDRNVMAIKELAHELKQNQSRERLRTWLSPPNPSINHNVACDIQHDGSATWFIQGSRFEEWKKDGSLLWIRGNPGSGKSILCSAIIEDIKNSQKATSALLAYYYFDFKDISKRDLRGLLSCLLTQLIDDSDHCWDALSQLYTNCRDGSEQPSEAALGQCLRNMLELPGQVPIYIIVDAVDECPNTTGTPSPREKVLEFLEDLVEWKHSNLHICVTSRPEHDIQSILNPLATGPRRVSLHDEGGQREDIINYVRSFVHNNRAMRRWRADDKELVISTLSERADGMFRWVFCQLDTLRRCIPASIRKALNELPITLDETYERTLECIPEEQRRHAHRLFQCLIAAIRPLRVEELTEIFAIQFDSKEGPNLIEGWRPDDPEEAVLTACSSLIAIADAEDSKIVQFSHFSVKEFLTSDRLATSNVGKISQYHIPLEPAHTILAQACLSVLLELDDKTDKKGLGAFPLAFYAAHNWVDHAKFENVVLEIEDMMECFFDPKKTHLAAWTWIHDIYHRTQRPMDDLPEHPSPPEATPLFYAAFCGFSGLANRLVKTHAEDVNATCYYGGTPLHAACLGGQLECIRLLLEHRAVVDARNDGGGAVSHLASTRGQLEVLHLVLQHGADVNARCYEDWTPLHFASNAGNIKAAQLVLEYGADVNAQSISNRTPLFVASEYHHLEVVRLLLSHGADVHIRGKQLYGEVDQTPFECATEKGYHEIAQLLLEQGAERIGGSSIGLSSL